MKEITCFYCDNEPEKRLLNGEYWCEQCRKSFSAAELRAHLIERTKETEQRVQKKECVTCGNQLIKPDWTTRSGVWCSWCGKEPESGEYIINLMRDRISVIDAVIAEGEPVVFKKARLGDKQAIASIFEKTREYKYGESWRKSFIGLGTVVVDFLITKLKSGNEDEALDVAVSLGDIGDERAVEPLIEALKTENVNDTDLLSALDKIGSPSIFAQLLNILEHNFSPAPDELQYSVQVKIVNNLNRILERAAAEIPDNDLIAASEIKDVSVRIRKWIELSETEDAYGKYTDGYADVATDTLDCSTLRETALREIKRRGLKG